MFDGEDNYLKQCNFKMVNVDYTFVKPTLLIIFI